MRAITKKVNPVSNAKFLSLALELRVEGAGTDEEEMGGIGYLRLVVKGGSLNRRSRSSQRNIYSPAYGGTQFSYLRDLCGLLFRNLRKSRQENIRTLDGDEVADEKDDPTCGGTVIGCWFLVMEWRREFWLCIILSFFSNNRYRITINR